MSAISPDDLFAKELCDLLASLEVASSDSGMEIACLLTGITNISKSKKMWKRKRGGAIGKVFRVA